MRPGRSQRTVYATPSVWSAWSRPDSISARDRLGLYVGRDTGHLDEAEIRRAVLETVSENATDGVLAPLFYALVGACLPLGSVPMALA